MTRGSLHIFNAIVLLCLCAGACPADGSFSDANRTAPLAPGTSAWRTEPEDIRTGALQTEAERVQYLESSKQMVLTNLQRTLDSVQMRIGVLRRQAYRPSPEELDQSEKDIDTLEQQLGIIPGISGSTLIDLQRSLIVDGIRKAREDVAALRQRWGYKLVVFGRAFFEAAPPQIPPEITAVPPGYLLSPGDQIKVMVWSRLGRESEYSLRIGPDGMVSVPGIGAVMAAGSTLSGFQQLLEKKLSRYQQLSVSVTLDRLRTIQVQVAGDAVKPGTYTLGGLSTVMNALYMAGGPSDVGSFRKIKLVSRGRPDRMIDLYDLFLRGSRKMDYQLEDQDMLFIPPVGSTVTVLGEVVRPGRYELEFPCALHDLLETAGGVKPSGYAQRIEVERVANSEYRVLMSASISEKAPAFELLPGDEVTVASVLPEKTNQVEIIGPVKRPGLYGLEPGMRLSQLVERAEGLRQDREVHLPRADVLRLIQGEGTSILRIDLEKALAGDQTNDIELSKFDRVFVYEPDQVLFRPRVVTVTGEVARPGTYRRPNEMRVSDLITAAGGVLPTTYLAAADLLRRDAHDELQLLKVDLRRALDGDPEADILVHDRDEMTVYSVDQAVWRDRTVRIEGAVQRPGTYPRAENMRVADLIFAAGGLLPEAGPDIGLASTASDGQARLSTVRVQPHSTDDLHNPLLRDRDVVTVPEVNPYLRAPEVVYLVGEVKYPGPYVLKSRDERLSDVIDRAGGLTARAHAAGAVLLRKPENLVGAQQTAVADAVLAISQEYADKQYQLQLAKLGVGAGVTAVRPREETRVVSSIEALGEQAEREVKAKELETTTAAEARSPKVTEEKTILAKGQGAHGDKALIDIIARLGGREPETEADRTSAMGAPVKTEKVRLDLDKVREVMASSRVTVDVGKAMERRGCPDDLFLKEGDRLYIPEAVETVVVAGAVLHPHAIAHQPGWSVEDYIRHSGGYSMDASKQHVVVVKANGNAIPRDMCRVVEKGDIIVVPNTGMVAIVKDRLEVASKMSQVISGVVSTLFVLSQVL